VPILLVHGYNSSVATWQPQSQQYLGTRAGTCVSTIDYGPYSTQWVTDDHVGPAVAHKILDLAQQSLAGGGAGKVIVVAHSMGGLAVRCAAAPTCAKVDGVADHIRELITFDTPNLGSFLKGDTRSLASDVLGPILSAACSVGAKAVGSDPTHDLCVTVRALGTSAAAAGFTPGSKQQLALPKMPTTIPVMAIAGSVKLTTSVFAHFTKQVGDAGDLVVDQNSALAEANSTGGLGGSKVIDCGAINIADSGAAVVGGVVSSAIVTALSSHAICFHTSETNNNSFLAEALDQIDKAVPFNSGRWTDGSVSITGGSLGAVTRGMTLAQASKAAGVDIEASGDGDYGPVNVKYLGIFSPGLTAHGVTCFDAANYEPGPTIQPKVITSAGFALGASVANLMHIYGSRLAYSGGTLSIAGLGPGGERINDGYYIHDNGGLLYFQTRNHALSGPIVQITSRPDAPTPAASHC
jgi:pimeloyl-ACP methyl ester carboxylesterase